MAVAVLIGGLSVALIGLFCVCLFQLRDRQVLKKEVIKLNDALDHIPSYIYIKERGKKYTYGNKATLDLFGVSASEIVGATDDQFFPPETVARLAMVDSEVFDSGQMSREEIISGSDPQTQTVYWEVKHPLRSGTGDIIGLVGISTDMTEVYRLRHELELRASTDGLTLTNNRQRFFDLAEIEFARSRRFRLPMAFMVVDIDFFKQVNDQYGHPTGDGVLRSFAKICQESIRSCDSIGRIGGEEFGIFLPSTTTNDALEVAERIRKENLTFPVDNENNKTITLTVSIGLARLLDTDESISDVYVRADAALYQAKQNGRNRTVTCKLGLDDSG